MIHDSILFSGRGFLALIILIPLFIGTLHPDMHVPAIYVPAIYRIDLGVHWIAFFMVSTALSVLLSAHRGKVVVLCLMLAVLLEAAQFYIDGRQGDILDMLANLAGVACAFALLKILRFSKETKPVLREIVCPLP